MGAQTILIAGNEPETMNSLADSLIRVGYAVESLSRPTQALSRVSANGCSLVITDWIAAAGIGEVDLLREVKKIRPELPVIVMASEGSIENAVAAMQAGAADYVVKPCAPDIVARMAKKYIANGNSAACRPGHPKGKLNYGGQFPEIITQDASLKKILKLSRHIASSNATVLIQGESGTGKELLAGYIHQNSGRDGNPLVALNCGALPESLAESELFGYEKGAFTGASNRKIGKFESAHGGTLLLDEIGEMELSLQVKLLRAIQQKQIDRIGGNRPIDVDTRIIAVTNVNLQKAVSEGKFRQDLFYRINVIPFTIPPLRKRKEDIPLLAKYFVAKYCHLNKHKIKSLDSKTVDLLTAHPWRGNVRELENYIERAVLLSEGAVINPEHLFFEDVDVGSIKSDSIQAGVTVRAMEKELIFGTLAKVNDNRTQAAEMLGISIRTLRNKLSQYRSDQA